MNIEQLVKHIKFMEGTGPYHKDTDTYHLYEDSVGKKTIGWGHNIDDRGLDSDVVEHQLRNDIKGAISDCRRLDFWDDLDDTRKLVIADMVFNMGLSRFNKFELMQAALRLRDYSLAASEMESSKWFNQTGRRSRKLVGIMRTGHWPVKEQKWV